MNPVKSISVFAAGLSLLFSSIQANAATVFVDFTGTGEVEILDFNTGDPIGFVLLGIDGSLSYDSDAIETSPNNFTGAASSVSLFFDLLVLDTGGQPVDINLPYFTDFLLNPELLTGDVFVGSNEIGFNFPTFPGGGPVPLSNEPFSMNLFSASSIFTAGDLVGATSTLLAAADPLSLFTHSEIVFQSGNLGSDLTQDIFFQIDNLQFTSLPSIPVPAAIWLFGSGLIGLIGIARRK